MQILNLNLVLVQLANYRYSIDLFKFNCSGWSDGEGNDIEYNFLNKESNTFLNSDYSSDSNARGRFSSANLSIVGVIVDEYDLASYFEMSITVNNNITQLEQSVAIFSV